MLPKEKVFMAKITIIVPNYNGIDYIEDCLNSLKEQTIADEIATIVVDNASEDMSRELVEEKFPEVKLIKLKQNFGFSRAVNEGIAKSDTPYVLLLNNDTRADKALCEQLLKTIEQDERIFSVSSKMLKMSDPEQIDGAGDLYCAFGWAYARGKGQKSNDHKYEKQMDVFAACAGAALYRKSILDEIGYFDEYHFAYLEDVDMGYRARIMGYRNVYCPTAIVLHAGSASSGSRYNDFKVRLSARNNVYMVFKNMPLLQLIINLPFLMIGFGIKALFFVLKGYGRAYLSGIKRGYLLCHEGRHLPYDRRNFKNYVKIQLEMWSGCFKRLIH